MPEYIGNNAAMLQGLLQAQKMGAENKTKTTQDIAQAVAGAVNAHYADKEKKLAAQKADKLKESMGLIEFYKNFEAQNKPQPAMGAPAGAPPPALPEGFMPVPPGIAAMGVPQEFMRPREKQYQQIGIPAAQAINKEHGLNLTGEEAPSVANAMIASKREAAGQGKIGPAVADINKKYGLSFTEDTPTSTVNTAITQFGATNRMSMRQSSAGKFDQAYRALTEMVKDLPSIQIERWTEADKKNYTAWVDATTKRGITVDDVELAGEGAPVTELGFWGNIGKLIGWKPANAPKTAPAAAPAKPKDLAGQGKLPGLKTWP